MALKTGEHRRDLSAQLWSMAQTYSGSVTLSRYFFLGKFTFCPALSQQAVQRVEAVPERIADADDRGHDDNADTGSNQRIFDRRRTRLVPQKVRRKFCNEAQRQLRPLNPRGCSNTDRAQRDELSDWDARVERFLGT